MNPLPEITLATKDDLPALFDVWESSVRATHSFLTEGDIRCLAPLAHKELAGFAPIHCLRRSTGEVFAFMGVAQCSIEMLFVHADSRGAGAGRALVRFAIDALEADCVEVNEQNPQAIGFYRRMGFEITGRVPAQPQGDPFPLLRMRLGSQPAQRAAPARAGRAQPELR
jgi:putative acetyltransferase